jgi:hypothetical protein
MSWNISWQTRATPHDRIAWLAAQGPDVVALQEGRNVGAYETELKGTRRSPHPVGETCGHLTLVESVRAGNFIPVAWTRRTATDRQTISRGGTTALQSEFFSSSVPSSRIRFAPAPAASMQINLNPNQAARRPASVIPSSPARLCTLSENMIQERPWMIRSMPT